MISLAGGGGNERTALEHFANGSNQIRIGGLLDHIAQYTDPACFRQKGWLVVHSQENDPGRWLVQSQLARRANPVEARHGDIRNDEVRDKGFGGLYHKTLFMKRFQEGDSHPPARALSQLMRIHKRGKL